MLVSVEETKICEDQIYLHYSALAHATERDRDIEFTIIDCLRSGLRPESHKERRLELQVGISWNETWISCIHSGASRNCIILISISIS